MNLEKRDIFVRGGENMGWEKKMKLDVGQPMFMVARGKDKTGWYSGLDKISRLAR